MGNFNILTHQTISPEEQHRHLAAVYALILSWPDQKEEETASSENFGEDTELTEETPAQDERSA
jgi:hypothetical protein